MQFIINDLYDLTLSMFERFGTDQEQNTINALETAEQENNRIFMQYITALQAGEVDAITTEQNGIIYTYTRSARNTGAIQRTTWRRDNNSDLLPLSHQDITSNEEATASATAGAYDVIIY